MAAGAWVLFDSFKEKMADGSVDLDNVTAAAFMALLATTSYTPDTTDVFVDDIVPATVEVTGAGYAREALTNVVWENTAGTIKWDVDDIAFAAAGGSITAKYVLLYYAVATDADHILIGYVDMDTSGGSIITNDGNTYVLQISSSGVFTLS